MDFKSVTIIIGTTNENESLICTVDTIINKCLYDDISELLLVRSKDASQNCIDAIELLENKYPDKVFGLVQKRSFVGGAIRDGFDMAKGSHIMLLPSDLGVSLDCVPTMIEQVKKNPSVISKTSRWLEKNSFYNYGKIRFVFNKTAQIFLHILYFKKLTDYTSPVQTAPAKLYKHLDWKELNFPFLLEMVLVPLRLGYRFNEIPVKCYGRKEGFSRNSVIQTALYLKTAIRIRFTPKSKLVKE